MNPQPRTKALAIALAVPAIAALGALALRGHSSNSSPKADAVPPELRPIQVQASDIPAEPEGVALAAPLATDNGPAIAVWEPVCDGDDARTAALGAGASRWLCVAVGGLGQFGRQPGYMSFQRVADELNRSDLRLSGADALRAARMAGATHLVTGEIAGDAARLTLTYTITEVAGGDTLGAPISVSGTPAEIAQALPALGRSIAERLGVRVAALPGGPTPAAADLAEFGSFPWRVMRHIPIDRLRTLEKLAPRLPAAGVCAVGAVYWQDPRQMAGLLNATVAAAPENAMVRWEAALCGSSPSPERARTAALLRRYPNNYLLVRASTRLKPKTSLDEALRMGQLITSIAPANAEGWTAYSELLREKAEALRKGRSARDVSRSERRSIGLLFAEAEAAAVRALRADPQDGSAWLKLSVGAQYAGDVELADRAYWMALRLCREDPRVFCWGLQMYQPGWRPNDAVKLARVTRLASAAVFDSPAYAHQIGAALVAANQSPMAYPQLRRAVAGWKSFAAEHPGESWPRLGLAQTYREMGQTAEAMQEYQGILRDRPSDVEARCQLAYLYLQRGAYAKSVETYRTAERYGQANDLAHGNLGMALVHLRRWKEAEAELRRGLRRYPRWACAYADLGEALRGEGRSDEAIACYTTAVRLQPGYADRWERLAHMLNESGRYEEAVRAAECSLHADRNFVVAYKTLGEACLRARRYAESADALRSYLKRVDTDADAHVLRAFALFAGNRRNDGVEECNACIRLAPKGRAAATARRLLRQYAEDAGLST